jgi:cephalosporin hydroxylase
MNQNKLLDIAAFSPKSLQSPNETAYMEESLSKTLGEVLEVIQARVVTDSTYFGIPCQRSPMDFWIYQEIIFTLKPDVIVEIGNFCGGSALSLAHLCDHLGNGCVIAVDIDHSRLHQTAKNHPRISFINGDACEVFDKVAAKCDEAATVLVIEDSSHEYQNTLNVLMKYSQLVTVGSFLTVEDSICHHGLDTGPDPGPYEAISDFIENNRKFYIDRTKEAFLITWNPKGYLKREN